MKTISTLLVISALSLAAGRAGKASEKTITGIWQGALGDIQEVTEVVVDISGKDSLVINVVGADKHIPAVISSVTDSTINFAYYDPKATDSCRFSGNINKTMNFIEGDWKLGEQKGTFFFQKIDAYHS